MAGEYTKELNGLKFSTLESSGIDSPNISKEIKDAAKKERGFFERNSGDIMPAAVKIKNSSGESFIAYGYKKIGDQQPLDISHVQDADGKVHKLKNVITVEFDTVNNPSKNEVKGAIKNDSANSLVNVIRAELSEQWEKFDRKEREKDGGRLHKGNKGELRADQSAVKYEVANVDSAPASAASTPAGNPALIKVGREGLA
jgi:predicted transcriptional regulator